MSGLTTSDGLDEFKVCIYLACCSRKCFRPVAAVDLAVWGLYTLILRNAKNIS